MHGRFAQRCLALAYAAACVAVLAGCDRLGDLYCDDAGGCDGGVDGVDAGDAGDAGARSAVLAIVGEGCADCIAQQCSVQVAACEANRACSEAALCASRCAACKNSSSCGPPCHEACLADYASGDEPTSELYACAVAECAGDGSCAGEPAVGRDLTCVGAYEFPAPRSVTTPLRLQLEESAMEGGVQPLLEAGIRVRVCRQRSDLDCDPSHAVQHSSSEGTVELELPSSGGDGIGFTPFRGFIAFDDPQDPPRILPTNLFADRSVEPVKAGALDTVIFTPTSHPGLLGTGNGVVAGVVFDCRSSNHARARGLTVRLDSRPEQGLRTNPSGYFIISDVPPGLTEITVSDGERTVSSTTVPVAPDTVTYLWMWPSAAP